jgi:signal transduction histidine kinase/CheY-like chemotaxis protein
MARGSNSRRFSYIAAIAVLAFVYFVAGKLSLKLALINVSASPVWPPAGIALAALLFLGYRAWPGVFIGAVLVNITTTGGFWTSLGIGTGNTLEALSAAWLINRFADGTRVFDRPQNVFKFGAAAILSALISPSIGVTSLALRGFAPWQNYSAIWNTWWLGDASGELIVAPLILLWGVAVPRKWTTPQLVEVSVLLLLLIGLAEIAFGGWLPTSVKNYPVSFICGPVVLWTAFRFTSRETATGIFILSAVALWGTLHGYGPFRFPSENQSLVTLETWSGVLAITAMALAAAMAEHRRAQAALEQQKSQVEAANRTKDNFLAMLSHELRTPLTPVLAAVESLERELLSPDDSKAALAMIRRNVELESQLIDDLLDLTRIAKNKLQLKFDPLDAHEIIRNVAEICRPEADARQLHLHLQLRAGAHFVSADATKFQQIIWNLLKNAIKFTAEHGDITISSTNPEPRVLTVIVSDTGIGIEADIMDRIFNPFEQGEHSFQHRYGGLGLGLAISKSLAQAHGGTLTAQSQGRGRGSTFVLTMNTVAPPQRVAEEVEVPSGPRSLRILLVEDHQDTCLALEKLLVRRGHLVAATHNMRSAMEAAARNPFDLLISDIALPDGTGTELMAYLRAISGIRGIAISGFGMNGDVERSLEAGFAEHLVKPVKMEKLEGAISRTVGA